MKTVNSPTRETAASELTLTQEWMAILRYWLRPPWGYIVAGTVLVAGGLALGWGWLVAAGLLPVLLSVLPCLAMCALGLCMMGRDKPSGTKHTPADDVVETRSLPPTVETSSREPAIDVEAPKPRGDA